MINRTIRITQTACLTVSLVVPLLFPYSSWAQPQDSSFEEIAKSMVLIPSGEPASRMLAKATVAVNHIKKMELPQASKAINEALQLDVQNTYLHFLNGFIYHLQGRYGDAQKYEMAIEGYQQALRLDPGNWIAQEFLGLAFLDTKQFSKAKGEFAGVLLMTPKSTVSIYGLMVASYLTGDPKIACTMADQFKKLSPTPNVGFIRSSVSVYASCGNFEKADQMRIELSKLNDEHTDVANLDQRLEQWRSLYRISTQTGLPESMIPLSPETSLNNVPASPASASAEMPVSQSDGSPRMVLVDVVMIATEELINTSQGVNLLNALTLQLGSSTQAAFSKTFNSAAAAGAQTTITRAVTIPALAYSLNIANANNAADAVLARPTLAAIEGLPSDFFSGINMNAAVISVTSLGASSTIPVDKRFGVKLAVTPAFLTNGKIQLKINAERTTLNPAVNSAGFAYRMEIAETTTNANVVMNFGDTLILSGLSEKATSESRNGVPVLQDIPVVQYLFSNKNTVNYQHSVLILVTPRLPTLASKADIQIQNPAIQALQEKLGLTTKYPSNAVSLLDHFKKSEMFREFQQGDVSVERWDRMSSTGARLKQALGFLYY
jgi:hypothetical protein